MTLIKIAKAARAVQDATTNILNMDILRKSGIENFHFFTFGCSSDHTRHSMVTAPKGRFALVTRK